MSVDAIHAKNRRRRRRTWPGLPKPRLTTGMRGLMLLLITFAEGWVMSYACTHTRLALPYGSPQWLITGSVLAGILLPLLWVLVLSMDGKDDQ